MRLETERLVLRPWREGDEESLVRHANNRKVWINLRDHFPHPYTLSDARSWIGRCVAAPRPPTSLAVEYAGEAIGGVGLLPMADVARFTAEVGYWFGEAWWGRGFATEALRRLTGYAFESFQYERLEAWVFATNPASARVLEKAGYEREAILRRAAFKDGRFLDCHLYVRLRPR
ncbi:MAG TPA: GNAT family N-acetyltransferase [Thermoanaerobaculia bacterium]|jgi:RimJ/RimL family protein N-acetyltransferase|nr:GNAT family N-acetyltransferase [Thermoanaerobaculia bacterium]